MNNLTEHYSSMGDTHLEKKNIWRIIYMQDIYSRLTNWPVSYVEINVITLRHSGVPKEISLLVAFFFPIRKRPRLSDQSRGISRAAVCVREWTQFPRACLLAQSKKLERSGRASCCTSLRPLSSVSEVNARSVVNLLRGNIWHISWRGGIEKETSGTEETAGIHRDAFEAGDAYTPTAAALKWLKECSAAPCKTCMRLLYDRVARSLLPVIKLMSKG